MEVTMDKIKLVQKVENECAPRHYTVTGGTFDEMLAAVKALDHRRFQSHPVKAWTVRREALDTLRSQGYGIEQDADFRPGEFNQHSIRDDGDKVYVTAYFEIRGSNGGWTRGPRRELTVALTDEMIEAEKERIEESARETFDIEFSADRFRAVREIARRAVREFGVKAVTAFEEATGGERTPEAFEAGLEAVDNLEV
jgi:hypothetical protein